MFCCKNEKEDVVLLTTRVKSEEKSNNEVISPIKSDHNSLLPKSCAILILQNIPIVLQCDMWECVYNLIDHGSDLTSFFTLTSGLTHTIIVIETVDGCKFGGFASGEWKKSQEFFGNGTSFVFSIDLHNHIEFYKWTQKNDYILWATNREIGMGGGGSGFAWTLYDDMNHGQSAATETFHNPCLYSPEAEFSDVDDPVDLILNVLSTVKEESEKSLNMRSMEPYKKEVDTPAVILDPSLKAELLPPDSTHSDNERSDRVDSVRSIKVQSPFKVSQVQVYGFSSEIRNRKKVPKLMNRLWGNRPSEIRPSR